MSKKIDALISEHVFEESSELIGGELMSSYNGYNRTVIPSYSTSIAAAWEMVATIVEADDSWEFSLNSMWAGGQDKIYSAHFYDSSNTLMSRREFADGAAWDGNIAMAICLAALKSKGVDYEQQN